MCPKLNTYIEAQKFLQTVILNLSVPNASQEVLATSQDQWLAGLIFQNC